MNPKLRIVGGTKGALLTENQYNILTTTLNSYLNDRKEIYYVPKNNKGFNNCVIIILNATDFKSISSTGILNSHASLDWLADIRNLGTLLCSSTVDPKETIGYGIEPQTASLPYTLNAIPVESGGNVTIDGQRYIADYVDVENKKLWKYVYYGLLSDLTYTIGFPRDSGWYNSSLSNSFELTSVSYNGRKFKENGEIKGLCSKLKSYKFYNFFSKGIKNGIMNSMSYIVVNLSISLGIDTFDKFKKWAKGVYISKPFATPYSIDLTDEEVQAFKELVTYYPTTNVMVTSDQLDGYTTFNYPISMENGWNLIKEQLGDTREYIYDMELQSAEAYVNSEYAVTLTELGV